MQIHIVTYGLIGLGQSKMISMLEQFNLLGSAEAMILVEPIRGIWEFLVFINLPLKFLKITVKSFDFLEKLKPVPKLQKFQCSALELQKFTSLMLATFEF